MCGHPEVRRHGGVRRLRLTAGLVPGAGSEPATFRSQLGGCRGFCIGGEALHRASVGTPGMPADARMEGEGGEFCSHLAQRAITRIVHLARPMARDANRGDALLGATTGGAHSTDPRGSSAYRAKPPTGERAEGHTLGVTRLS